MARFHSGRYKSAAHLLAAQGARGDYYGTSVSVTIDTREIVKLEKALRDAGVGVQKSRKILAQTLNRAGKRIETRLVKSVQQWTGIKTQKRIRQDMKPIIATPAMMRAGVRISGRHLRVTRKDFGASWRRSWTGGRHRAWGRAQTAQGSFMAFSGRAGGRFGGGLLFHRTGRSRLPIQPLWGPNIAREVQRHSSFVRAVVRAQALWFMKDAVRRVDVEFKRVKARYGL